MLYTVIINLKEGLFLTLSYNHFIYLFSYVLRKPTESIVSKNLAKMSLVFMIITLNIHVKK